MTIAIGHDVNAHDVSCPVCHVAEGKNCLYPDGTDVGPEISHTPRAVEVMRMLEIAGRKAREKARENELLGGWSIEVQS